MTDQGADPQATTLLAVETSSLIPFFLPACLLVCVCDACTAVRALQLGLTAVPRVDPRVPRTLEQYTVIYKEWCVWLVAWLVIVALCSQVAASLAVCSWSGQVCAPTMLTLSPAFKFPSSFPPSSALCLPLPTFTCSMFYNTQQHTTTPT